MSPQDGERVTVPDEVRTLALQRRDRFETREAALGLSLKQIYAAELGDYRRQLNQSFMQYFSLNLNPETNQPEWDLTTAKRSGLLDSVTNDFDAAVSSAEDDASALLEESLVESYNEGYDEGRYLLALAGVDIDALDTDLDADQIAQTLIDNGIDGVSWAERLKEWSATFADKFGAAVQAAAVTSASLSATLEMYDVLAAQLANRVIGLGENEYFRADAFGAAFAYLILPDSQSGEVWLTRQDALVCPFCAALNLRITPLRPENDSHANCRCMKVPLALLDEYVSDTHELFNTDISFPDFQALGRGPGKRGSYTPASINRYTNP